MWNFAIILIITLTLVNCNEFCDKQKEICGDKPHICCGYNGEFQRSCPKGIQMFELTPTAIEHIVDKHNTFRDFIASGKHEKFEKASRIPELVWNDNLALTAKCHILTCMDGFDKCRNTLLSKSVTQNIYKGTDVKLITIEELFSRALDKWTQDAVIKSMAHLTKFIHSPVIKNFAQIIHETAYKFGCAGSWVVGIEGFKYDLVCNYNDGNVKGQKIYLAGESRCLTGKSSKYPNLCSIDEPPISRNCTLAAIE